MNIAGFDNFRNLYNNPDTDPVQWDINQLRSEQQTLQPIHTEYLGNRTTFTWLSENVFTNSNVNVFVSDNQVMPGGIDILNYASRVKYGCKLLGYTEAQGCKP